MGELKLQCSAVILAAGMSERMGFPKLLLSRDGRLLVLDMLEKLRGTGWDSIALVVSASSNFEAIKNQVSGVTIIVNHHPVKGMISSIRQTLDWAREADGLLAWPVDHPLVSEVTLQRIRDSVDDEAVCIPVFKRKRGHPTFWGRFTWDHLRSPLADGGARDLFKNSEIDIHEVDVPDEKLLTNINTPEDAMKYGLSRYEP